MRRMGIVLLKDAVLEAHFKSIPMCVVHAAHAAEILLKARIAQEDPLLIFSKLPNIDATNDSFTFMDFLERSRTLSYMDLPNRLWEATRIKIENIEEYENFGRLRNQIIHTSMVNAKDLDVLTLRYSLELLDPLIERFWGRSVIDFIRNDPFEGCFALSSGMLESSIRNACDIDERLRQILGEESKKAWERMMEQIPPTPTPEELESQYQFWLESGGEAMEYKYKHEYVDPNETWEKFLESF